MKYLQYGAMDYLRKPIDLCQLEAALQRALRRRTELVRERGMAQLLKEEVINWDGKGYPDGLAGENIPWGARLLAAAEIYDAVATARPYREQLTPELAVERMRGMIGSVLAPEVHQGLSALVESGAALVFVAHEPSKELSL